MSVKYYTFSFTQPELPDEDETAIGAVLAHYGKQYCVEQFGKALWESTQQHSEGSGTDDPSGVMLVPDPPPGIVHPKIPALSWFWITVVVGILLYGGYLLDRSFGLLAAFFIVMAVIGTITFSTHAMAVRGYGKWLDKVIAKYEANEMNIQRSTRGGSTSSFHR